MTAVIDLVKHRTHDTKWIVDRFRNDTLVVDNSFQRRFVWIEKHQVRLIETILKRMPIPEIYLWEQEVNHITGDTKFSIIDGQQRLKSIYSYINNEFSLKKVHLEEENADYADKKFSELSIEDKSEIWNYEFAIRIVGEHVSKQGIKKMFLRLNSTGTFLNAQELRNAKFEGKFIELAGEVAEFPFWDKYSIFSSDGIRRMKDIEFISSILIFFRGGIGEATNQSNINHIYDTYNKVYEESDEDKYLFKKILEGVEKIINDDEKVNMFLKKQTQLYTLIVTVYYFIRKTNKDKKIESHVVQNYKYFVEAYNDDTNQLARKYFGNGFVEQIDEYRKLSRAGTQAKKNRAKRFSILKSVLLS